MSKSLTLVVAMLCAVMTGAVPAVRAHAADTAVMASTDAAKIALGEQIVENLQMARVLSVSAKDSLMKRGPYRGFSETERARLGRCIDAAFVQHRAKLNHLLAVENVDRFTIEQLNDLLTLSKIKYIQDVVLFGADHSLAAPDESSMTPAEYALVEDMDQAPVLYDFIDNLSTSDAVMEEMAAALLDGVALNLAQYRSGNQ